MGAGAAPAPRISSRVGEHEDRRRDAQVATQVRRDAEEGFSEPSKGRQGRKPKGGGQSSFLHASILARRSMRRNDAIVLFESAPLGPIQDSEGQSMLRPLGGYCTRLDFGFAGGFGPGPPSSSVLPPLMETLNPATAPACGTNGSEFPHNATVEQGA